MTKLQYLIGLLLLGTFLSCKDTNSFSPSNVLGYKPIYSNDTNLFLIKSKPARAVTTAGKIYAKGNYIFQNEIGEGIHVINNTNPANAERIGFIQIKGSQEISIKDNYLYSNNFGDLVVVNIADINNVAEVKRIKNAFSAGISQSLPPGNGTYFECIDHSKGIVAGWVQDSIDNPKCRN